MSNEDMTWFGLAGSHPNELGLLPSMIDRSDPDPAAVQFDKRYGHGGGWRPMDGFKKLKLPGHIQYPGDPPMKPIFFTRLRDEKIYVYRYGFVGIFQPDGSFEVARMD